MNNLRFKLFLHQLTHWEYWPFSVVYFPMYFVWLYYSICSRAFFFFLPSNPSIKNAGFLCESKKEIYDILPNGSYPRTALIKPGATVSTMEQQMREAGIHFPCIAKPDIGMKGKGVEIIKGVEDLESYRQKSGLAFLLQELINLPNELGIFYYKIPGEASGKISGIVKKEFLSILGDGQSTMEQLIFKNTRCLFHWQLLKKHYGTALQSILPKGKEEILVPFGNHSRGTKFIDASHLVDKKLLETIDQLCQQIPGFYYGRLDIRYNTIEELRDGKNYSIIELNGAGSEPGHMYDPSHSIFYAWKEIGFHYKLLYKISKKNHAAGHPHMDLKTGFRMLQENRKIIQALSDAAFHQ